MFKHGTYISFVISCSFILTGTFFTHAHAKPADFNLFTPTGNVVIATWLPTLEWEDTSDAENFTFTVYYSSHSDFSLMISSANIPSNTTTYTVTSNLTENATYWWNVYAENDSSVRTYASTETFRVNLNNEDPIGGTVPLSPPDGSVALTNNPTFYWALGTDPDPGDQLEHRVFYAHAPDFSYYPATPWVSPGTTSWWTDPVWDSLDENTSYYWFVGMLDSGAREWPLSKPGSALVKYFWVNGSAEAPSTPSLSSPDDGAQLDGFDAPDGKPTLSWTASTDPDPLETSTYTVRYSSTRVDFNNGVYTASATATNTTFTLDTALTDNVTFWWSVVAVDDSSVTLRAYSSTRTFVMSWLEEPPDAFDLLLPSDTTDVYDLSPTLTWESATDPDPEDTEVWYRLKYSDDQNFASFTEVTDISDTTYTFSSNLEIKVTYYWVIHAYGRYDSAEYYTVSSSTFSFYTENHPPGSFSLVKSSGIQTSADVDLEWTASIDPDEIYGDSVSYTVMYAEILADLGTVNATTYADIPSTTYTALGLHENETYYWTVWAVDQNNFWTCTSTWTLRINATNEKPLSFSLVSPSGIVNDATPTFDWQDAIDPDPGDTITYTLVYDSHSDFSTAYSSAGLLVSEFTPSVSLQEDTTYWWKARAVDGGGLNTVSDSTWTVIINADNQSPSGFNLISPSSGTIVPTRNPIFVWESATDGDPGDILSYTIYYSTDSTFSVDTSSAGLLSTSYTSPVEMIENTTYYWYVKVQDQVGAENFSQSTWTVVINGTNEYPIFFDLISPTYGELLEDPRPTVDWSDSYDPDPASYVTYTFYYSKYSDFSSSSSVSGISDSEYIFSADLDDNSVYYWKVEARDSTDNVRLSNQTSWYFVINLANDPPVAFDLVSPEHNEVVRTNKPLLDWADAVDPDPFDSITYRIIYSPDPNLILMKTELSNLTDSFYSVLISLLEETTYYWTAYASDGEEEVAATSIRSFYVEAQNSPPTSFNLLSPAHGSVLSVRSISFDWEDSTDSDYGDVLTYRLMVSEDKQFSSGRDFYGLSESQYTVNSGFYENRVYYWKVSVSDLAGATRDSDQTWSFFIPIIDIPKRPEHIRGSLSNDWNSFVIYWDEVVQNEDESEYVDPGGFNIYRSDRLQNLHRSSVYAHVDAGVEFYEDTQVNEGLFFYLIRTVDSSGSESKNSIIVASSPEESMIVLSEEGDVYLIIFTSANSDELINYRFEVERVPEDEGGRILGSYRFKAYNIETNEELPDFKLRTTSRVFFYYSSFIQRAAMRSPSINVSSDELGVFWHNGVEYVKCGGTVNPRTGLLSLETKRLGSYRIQQVLRATEFELGQIWPRKIFTPNGDGINDEINFNFENPRESVVTGKIFDITGAFVADMVTGINGTWSLLWDGRDSSGSYVEKGVYIYQIEVEGKVINGTIVVAR